MDSFWQGIVAGLALERLANLELPLGGPWKKMQQPLKITMASLSRFRKNTLKCFISVETDQQRCCARSSTI